MNEDCFYIHYVWMVTCLKLSHTPLDIYALVHGFTVHGNLCRVTNKYITNFTGVTVQTIRNSVKKLIDANLLLTGKYEYSASNIVNTYFVRYTYDSDNKCLTDLYENWESVSAQVKEFNDIDPATCLIPSQKLLELLEKKTPSKILSPPVKDFDPPLKKLEGEVKNFDPQGINSLPNSIVNNSWDNDILTNNYYSYKTFVDINSNEEFISVLQEFEIEFKRNLTEAEIKRLHYQYTQHGKERVISALDIATCNEKIDLNYIFGILHNMS